MRPKAISQKEWRTVGRQHLRHVVAKALGHRERPITDVDRQQQFAFGVYGDPDPLGRTLQALDGIGRADRTVLDRAEEGEECIELHLSHQHVVQDVLGEGLQLLGRFDQPLQHRMWGHLKHPCRAPDT